MRDDIDSYDEISIVYYIRSMALKYKLARSFHTPILVLQILLMLPHLPPITATFDIPAASISVRPDCPRHRLFLQRREQDPPYDSRLL